MSTRRLASIVIVALLSLTSRPTTASDIRIPGRAEIASETGAGASYPEAISADGRYVLVRSTAPNLLPGQADENGASDLFLVDRDLGATTLLTHRAGAPLRTADAGSRSAAMSPDGAFVLYTSWASDLVAGAGATAADSPDVYLWRRSTGTSTLLSHLAGQPLVAAGQSEAVAVTPDGAFALFGSDAAGLAPGTTDTNGAADVFLYSLASGQATLVSTAAGSGGTQAANAASLPVVLRANGNEVLFNSYATDLPGSGDGSLAVYVRQTASGAITRAPVAFAEASDWTPDGRYVLFHSGATVGRWDRQTGNLFTFGTAISHAHSVAISDDGGRAVFELDSQAYLYRGGSPALACLSCGGGGGGGAARAISGNGRYAAFARFGSLFEETLLYDSVNGLFEPISRQSGGAPAPTGGFFGAMSPDGLHFAFACRDAGIEAAHADRNDNWDAFHFQRGAPAVDLLSPSTSAAAVVATLGPGSQVLGQSAAGDEVLFSAATYLLDPAAEAEGWAAWAYRPADGRRRLLSPLPGQPNAPAGGDSRPLALAADDRVLLASFSAELVPGADLSGTRQLFVYRPASQDYRLLTARSGSPLAGTAGWIDAVRSDPGLVKVIFTSTAGDLVDGLSNYTAAGLFSCRTDGSGCQLLSPDAEDASHSQDRSVTNVVATPDLATVAFASYASNLVAGAAAAGSTSNVYAWRSGSGLSLLSRAAGGTGEANGYSEPEDISADGRFVLATSQASNLAAGVSDTNDSYDAYLYDSDAGTWQLVSSSAASPAVAGSGYGLALSADGRFVLFASTATDIVPGQVDISEPFYPPIERLFDLFLLDRQTGEKRLVSHAPGETLVASGFTAYGTLSEDGRRVAMLHTEPDLYRGRLQLWERDGGGPRELARSAGGPYVFPLLAPLFLDNRQFDGRVLLFSSFNDNLVPGDTNNWSDGFVLMVENLFRDGFESGDTSAWSATLP